MTPYCTVRLYTALFQKSRPQHTPPSPVSAWPHPPPLLCVTPGWRHSRTCLNVVLRTFYYTQKIRTDSGARLQLLGKVVNLQPINAAPRWRATHAPTLPPRHVLEPRADAFMDQIQQLAWELLEAKGVVNLLKVPDNVADASVL